MGLYNQASFRQYGLDHRDLMTEALQAAALDENREVATSALTQLVLGFELKNQAITGRLVELLSDENLDIALGSAELLAKIDAANPLLLEQVKSWSQSGKASLERQAVKVYVSCIQAGNETLVDTMLDLLNDQSWGMRPEIGDGAKEYSRDFLIYKLAVLDLPAASRKIVDQLKGELERLEKQAARQPSNSAIEALNAVYQLRAMAENSEKQGQKRGVE
jgi:hypothetical protein